jgi:cytidine deaminase
MSDDHLAAAAAVAEQAYAPYSDFRVGAVAVTAGGEVFAGANVENAAFGSTLCAEAVAIGNAVSAGHRRIDLVAVVGLDTSDACYPCGNCRQLMNEFGVATVVVRASDGSAREHRLSELLPHSFGPESL